jgi:hypothetical protein
MRAMELHPLCTLFPPAGDVEKLCTRDDYMNQYGQLVREVKWRQCVMKKAGLEGRAARERRAA